MTEEPPAGAWSRFAANRLAYCSSWALLALVVAVLAWPVVLRVAGSSGPGGARFAQLHDPNAVSDQQFAPPNREHWFGTDLHGRDLFGRILTGARVSLLVGVAGAVVSMVIGVLWGALAGYAGGRIDNLLMRLVDILYSLPSIIFVIVLITTLEGLFKAALARIGSPGLVGSARLLFLVAGLAAVSWLNMARIVRGQVLTLRQLPFVEASRALGARPGRILFRHILPNVYGIVIVYLTLTVPAVILYESFLSYLGLGIQPPMASWGSLIAEGAEQMNSIRIYWWLIVFPGVFLVGTLLAFNFLGNGLRDAWKIKR